MASTTAATESGSNGSVGVSLLAELGPLAMLAAGVVNVLVLFVGLAIVEFPAEHVGGPFGPPAVGPVVGSSAVATVGGTLVYGAVTRHSARPNRTFSMIAGVALVLSSGMFLAPDPSGAPPRVFAVLAVMHVGAAVAVVGVLTRATGQEVVSR